jgi:ABC-type oligopeptide transport system ATPase subunit
MVVVLTARDLTRHYEVSRDLFKGHALARALNGMSFELEAGKALAVVQHVADDVMVMYLGRPVGVDPNTPRRCYRRPRPFIRTRTSRRSRSSASCPTR